MKQTTVAVVGLGLIGGSLARALTRAGYRVVGVDSRASALRQARRERAVTVAASRLDASLQVDVVVLAAPPRANIALLRRLARGARRNAVITDVSSVKREICREAGRLRLRSFVGGHPMAGRERSGFSASDPELFRGRPWILTPTHGAKGVAIVRRLARAVGARPIVVAPAEHDRAVAFLSHVPQLVSWALLRAAREDEVARRRLRLAGPAFADMTRLARSPRRLWREILALNRDETERALRAFRAALRAL